MYAAKWKKSVWKGCIFCDLNCIHFGKSKPITMEERSMVARGGVEGGEGWISKAQGILSDSEKFSALYYS